MGFGPGAKVSSVVPRAEHFERVNIRYFADQSAGIPDRGRSHPGYERPVPDEETEVRFRILPRPAARLRLIRKCDKAMLVPYDPFWNVAQVIVDQFLASAEEKWRRLSGITLLLPHGFEGQGPEHSSARLERFLNLATQHNFQVVVPSTPAQYFHCLRRQMHRRWLKPLILFTPKSLLRHPRCVSDLDDLAHGHFCRVLPDAAVNPPATTRILLCCGKIYYELLEKREELARTDVAILRMEQIYPLPRTQLLAALDSYPDDTPVYWVQEEPFNMGASQFLKIRLQNRLYDRFPFQTISRRTAASPATGWGSLHRKEQQQLLDRAFHET